MIDPITTIVIPFAVCFLAIISVQYVRKRWELQNADDGNKYNRLRHKCRRARCHITGQPVPPKFECLEGQYLS
jgi:hypothetical protein